MDDYVEVKYFDSVWHVFITDTYIAHCFASKHWKE